MQLVKVGMTDSITQCQCCGKDKLKRTVVLLDRSDDGTGEFLFYGTTCATRALAENWGSRVDKARMDAVGREYLRKNRKADKLKRASGHNFTSFDGRK